MAVLGALNFLFQADTTKFRAALKSAGNSARSFTDGAAKTLSGGIGGVASAMTQALGPVGLLGTAIAGTGMALTNFVVTMGKANREIQEYADILGNSYWVQKNLEDALDTFGVSATKTRTAMERLGITLTDARDGSKKAQKAFSDMGVDIDKLNLMSSADQLYEMGKAFATVTSQSKKLNLAKTLFGKSSFSVLKALEAIGPEIKSIIEEASRSEALLTPAELDRLEEATQSYQKLGQTMGGVWDRVAATIAGPVTSAIQGFTGYLDRVTINMRRFEEWKQYAEDIREGFWSGEDVSGKRYLANAKKTLELQNQEAEKFMGNLQKQREEAFKKADDEIAANALISDKKKADALIKSAKDSAKKMKEIFSTEFRDINKFFADDDSAFENMNEKEAGKISALGGAQVDPSKIAFGNSNYQNADKQGLDIQKRTEVNTSTIAMNTTRLLKMIGSGGSINGVGMGMA
jgi:hypothetical protein